MLSLANKVLLDQRALRALRALLAHPGPKELSVQLALKVSQELPAHLAPKDRLVLKVQPALRGLKVSLVKRLPKVLLELQAQPAPPALPEPRVPKEQ